MFQAMGARADVPTEGVLQMADTLLPSQWRLGKWARAADYINILENIAYAIKSLDEKYYCN